MSSVNDQLLPKNKNSTIYYIGSVLSSLLTFSLLVGVGYLIYIMTKKSEIGEKCKINDGCVNNNCINEKCSKLLVGMECINSNDCLNNACGSESLEPNAKKICCLYGKSVSIDGREYCTDNNILDKQKCLVDEQCKTKYCRKDKDGKNGVCGKLNVGAECNLDTDCINPLCGVKITNDKTDLNFNEKNLPNKQCCNSESVASIDGRNYCKNLKETEFCTSTDQCASETFCSIKKDAKIGTCKSLLKTGEKCTSETDCNSKNCNLQISDNMQNGNKVCCVSDKYITMGKTKYCSNLGDNQSCKYNDQCISKNCKDNMGGSEEGKCAPPLNTPLPTSLLLPTNSVCSTNSQCKSGTCQKNMFGLSYCV